MGTTNRGLTPDDRPPSAGLSRRDFFSLVGATTALAATVACERKGQTTVVPYTKRPVEVIPGVANYYASTFQEGRRIYPVLVKTREGRPIHVTGNDAHGGVKGKTSPRAMADVLRLYDPDRLRAPRFQGRAVSWTEAESQLGKALRQAKTDGKSVLLLTGAVASPSHKALIADLMAALPTLKHMAWDAAAGDAADEGARDAFGQAVEIVPRLDKARVILSLGSDVLNGADVEAVAAFASKRRLGGSGEAMNRLWVFEGPMTLTGSNADQRYPVKPSRLAPLAFALAKELNARHAVALPAGADLSAVPAGMPRGVDIPARAWTQLVDDLAAARRLAVVLCGEEMPAEAHVAAHLLNAMLGSGGVELRPAEPLASRRDLALAAQEMASGRYAAAILWDVNPALAFPQAAAWKDAFAKIPFRAWVGLIEDESSAQCDLVLPENHWLESWGDFGFRSPVTLRQPTIGTLYDTRQGEDVLLAAIKSLGATAAGDYHAYLRTRWPTGFQAALHDGLVNAGAQQPLSTPAFIGTSIAPAVKRAAARPDDGRELVLFPGFATYDGQFTRLDRLDDRALVKLHSHKSEWFVRQARRILVDRAAAGKMTDEAGTRLGAIAAEGPDPVLRLRAIWTMNALGRIDNASLHEFSRDRHEAIRAWAIRLLTDDMPLDTIFSQQIDAVSSVPEDLIAALVGLARHDPSGLVPLVLASTLQRLPVNRRLELARPLAAPCGRCVGPEHPGPDLDGNDPGRGLRSPRAGRSGGRLPATRTRPIHEQKAGRGYRLAGHADPRPARVGDHEGR